jgi:general secretion pathway protein J
MTAPSPSPLPSGERDSGRGFTLLEVLLALSIVAAMLVIVFGGLRIGLAAWQRGEERTAKLDHTRSLAVLLERALDGAFPYRIAAEGEQEARALFEGLPDRLTFVTLSPPFPTGAPAAFTAVSLSADATGLALRQQILPNPVLPDRLRPLLVDARTRGLRFRYLGREPEAWQDTWDAVRDEGLPRAVEITLVAGAGPRGVPQTLTLPIRTAAP